MRISDWSSDVCSSDLDVGLHEAHAHVVELRVAAGDVEHVLVDVDTYHFAGTAHRGVHAEAAGVAAQVEHALAFNLLREPLPVVALVGAEAGLVRAGGVGAGLLAVLGDDCRRRGPRALPGPGVETIG